jgi:hypothetical protein
MKRRAIELFGLNDEIDVFGRLEFELFAFGILPSSASLPLLKDREVIYVNLLPPRPPTPFSINLAPPRAENSLIAEVRRPSTGQPFEVVYSHVSEANGSSEELRHGIMKRGRFKEHFSEAGSRPQSQTVPLTPERLAPSGSGSPKSPKRSKSATKAWYKETEPPVNVQEADPFDGDSWSYLADDRSVKEEG